MDESCSAKEIIIEAIYFRHGTFQLWFIFVRKLQTFLNILMKLYKALAAVTIPVTTYTLREWNLL